MEGRLWPVLQDEAPQLPGGGRLDLLEGYSPGPLPGRDGVQEAEGVDRLYLDLLAARELGEEVQAAAEGVTRERRKVDRSQDAAGRHPQLAAHHQDGQVALRRTRSAVEPSSSAARPGPGGADHDQVGPGRCAVSVRIR